ncbi:MAG: AraC family transcriptional regulator, partial [Bacteroidota bacterium]
EISFNTSVIILFALIAQGIFTAALLPLKAENRVANRYLALLILLLSLWLCDSFFQASGIYGQNPDFYFLPIYFSLAFGPLIYFYTKALTLPQFRFKTQDLLHFLPAFLQMGLYLYLQSQSYTFRRNFWINVHQPYTFDLEFILSISSVIIYLLLSLQQLRAYKQQVENYFSSLQSITLNWLRSIHLFLAFLATFWLLESIGRLVWDYYPSTSLSSITIGIAVLLLAVGGLLQKDLTKVTELSQPAEEAEKAAAEVKKSIDPALVQKIQEVMRQQELFLNQELTLKEFARALEMTDREVSHLLNTGLNIRFIDFVNQHRVERVQMLIKKGQSSHLSLLGIALESGFNSKSTFNRVFKRMTGQSPSDYQKAAQNAS